MVGFKAAFLNEMDKLLKKKKFLVALLLSVLAVVVGQLSVSLIQRGTGLRIVGSSEFPILVLPILTNTILPLFAAFVTIDMFCGEFSSNTMKLAITRPVSRFKVYLAKVLSIAAFILINLIFVMILSTIAGMIFNVSSASFGSISRIVISYLLVALPVFVFSLIIVLLSNIIKGGLAVFFSSVLVFLALFFLGTFFSSYASFFITSMFDWYRLWTSEMIDVFKILRQFLVLIGCGIMLFTAGFYLFDRRDL